MTPISVINSKGYAGTEIISSSLQEAPATLKRDVTALCKTLDSVTERLEWCGEELASIQAQIYTTLEGGTNNEI